MPGISQANKPQAAINNTSTSKVVNMETILAAQQKKPPKIIGLNFDIPPIIKVGIPNNIIINVLTLPKLK